MKKCYFFFFFLLSFVAHSQVINFPDANFKNILLTQNLVDTNADGVNDTDVDTNNDGEINQTEALQVTWLSLSGSAITDVTGIEFFTQLTDLGINGCPITSINLSNFSLLWRIWCTNTLVTEINLCGTQVRSLWCTDNPNLTTLYLKNGIISNDLARNDSQTPPPLHNFEFYNSPLLNYICYDDGEYAAVFYGIGQNTVGKTLTTSCNNTCVLSNPIHATATIFTLYPNPTQDLLNIRLSNSEMVKEVTVYNALGQKLLTINHSTIIDVSTLSQGTYFIRVETDNEKETQPFIKI
jgi:Secretion system C-terminal sorting domain